jgi:hypothetical protein
LNVFNYRLEDAMTRTVVETAARNARPCVPVAASSLGDDEPAVLVDPGTGRAPARWHRFVTIPALVIAFVVLLAHKFFLLSLIVFPPVIAMPWLAMAAARPTTRAIERAHTAVRSAGHVMCAVGVLALFWALPNLDAGSDLAPGLIVMAASAAILAAAGFEPRESRIGLALAVIGGAQLGAMILLVWFTPGAFALLPTGVLMLLGGIAWLAEAEVAPAVESTLPHAIVRC